MKFSLSAILAAVACMPHHVALGASNKLQGRRKATKNEGSSSKGGKKEEVSFSDLL